MHYQDQQGVASSARILEAGQTAIMYAWVIHGPFSNTFSTRSCIFHSLIIHSLQTIILVHGARTPLV